MSETEDTGQGRGRGGPSAAEVRRARQKLALKANMARRKAQMRALSAREQGRDDPASMPQNGVQNEKE